MRVFACTILAIIASIFIAPMASADPIKCGPDTDPSISCVFPPLVGEYVTDEPYIGGAGQSYDPPKLPAKSTATNPAMPQGIIPLDVCGVPMVKLFGVLISRKPQDDPCKTLETMPPTFGSSYYESTVQFLYSENMKQRQEYHELKDDQLSLGLLFSVAIGMLVLATGMIHENSRRATRSPFLHR